MKAFLLAPLVAVLAACTSQPPLLDHGGEIPAKAADGSVSPITQEQSLAIARQTIATREGWPEHKIGDDKLIHTVSYGSRRINNGGWRVVAHRAVMEANSGNCGYDPIPPAIIIINKHGAVTHYVREYEQR